MLLDDIDNLHVKCQGIQSNQKLDRSKFFMLWLHWKTLVGKQSQEIYHCTYDDNINLLFCSDHFQKNLKYLNLFQEYQYC